MLDAQYRGVAKFGLLNVTLRNLTAYDYFNSKGNNQIFGNPLSTRALPDKKFNQLWGEDTGSSRYNCDVYMQYADITDSQGVVGCPAVQHCRNLVLPGFSSAAADLPIFSVLARIRIEADYIDRLDPTLTQYSGYALGWRNPNGRGRFTGSSVHPSGNSYWWSSTPYKNISSSTLAVVASFPNTTYGGNDSWTLGVIPIIELSE